jgi:hypothetical protein
MATDDSWRIEIAEADGQPLIVRIRNQLPTYACRDKFPHLLGVSWKYDSPNAQGMPTEEDLERMCQLEDLLVDALENAQQAFMTVVITGTGVREWQWYAQNQIDVMELVNETLGELEPFPVQFMCEDDPTWIAYSRFQASRSISGAE